MFSFTIQGLDTAFDQTTRPWNLRHIMGMHEKRRRHQQLGIIVRVAIRRCISDMVEKEPVSVIGHVVRKNITFALWLAERKVQNTIFSTTHICHLKAGRATV
jgi:hypothetical protein